MWYAYYTYYMYRIYVFPGLWGFQSLVGYRYVVYGVLSAYGGEPFPIRLLCIFQFLIEELRNLWWCDDTTCVAPC